jgi:hypothetical protein
MECAEGEECDLLPARQPIQAFGHRGHRGVKVGIACFAVFISLLYAVGVGMLGYGLWGARLSTQAAAWPTTPTPITGLEVRENTDSDGTSRLTSRYRACHLDCIGQSAHADVCRHWLIGLTLLFWLLSRRDGVL